jgi:hypothetical protein
LFVDQYQNITGSIQEHVTRQWSSRPVLLVSAIHVFELIFHRIYGRVIHFAQSVQRYVLDFVDLFALVLILEYGVSRLQKKKKIFKFAKITQIISFRLT